MRFACLSLLSLLLCACPSEVTPRSTAADTTLPDAAGAIEPDVADPPDSADIEAAEDVAYEDAPAPEDTQTLDTADAAQPDADQPVDPCEGVEKGGACDLDNDPCTLDVCNSLGECVFSGGTEPCSAEQLAQPCWTFTCAGLEARAISPTQRTSAQTTTISPRLTP